MERTGQSYEFFRLRSPVDYIGGGESGELYLHEPLKLMDFSEGTFLEEATEIMHVTNGGMNYDHIQKLKWKQYSKMISIKNRVAKEVSDG